MTQSVIERVAVYSMLDSTAADQTGAGASPDQFRAALSLRKAKRPAHPLRFASDSTGDWAVEREVTRERAEEDA